MKHIIAAALMLLAALALKAQSISNIEANNSWYYIYDQNGKRIKTLSATQGEIIGYSSNFYIIKRSSFYTTYDVNGNQLHTFSISSVGEIINVAGDTFTSRRGSWIYTWSKDGKNIATRAAQ